MKTIILKAILLSSFISGFAQAPEWSWVHRAGSTENDNGRVVKVDSSGYVYVMGIFQDTAIFQNDTISSFGGADIFLVKYDSSGNLVWVKHNGGHLTDYGNAMDMDISGNLYVTGFITDSAIFDNFVLISNGLDMFIAKYDTAGKVLWATGPTGNGSATALKVAVDNMGNTYVTGSFSLTVDFGSVSLSSISGEDIFIVKYNSDGNVVWAVKAGGLSINDRGYGLSLDAEANVYVSGYFDGTAVFEMDTVISNGSNDTFLAKYDSSGNILWVRNAGGSGDDRGHRIATDSHGNSFVTGTFTAPAAFDSIVLVSGSTFIAKYDSSGNVVWAAESLGNEGKVSLIDEDDNFYISSGYSGTVVFGSTTLTSAGGDDIFIAKYDSGNNALWALSAGGLLDDEGSWVTIDNDGNYYVTGVFEGSAIFGTDTISTFGSTDIFIAKLRSSLATSVFFSENDEVSIFPNPSGGRFKISGKHIHDSSIEILNMLGNKVYSEKFVNEYVSLNLPAGIYIISVTSTEKVYYGKIIIE